MSTDARTVALGLARNLRVLAALSVVFLATLAIAPAKEWFTEWRVIQDDYNLRAVASGAAPKNVGIAQIWRPEADVVDRCTSCHVGMGGAPPLAGQGVLFDAHPDVHHDVAKMGCTQCHDGQGRATSRAAAHGNVAHWEAPMLERAHFQASCGWCHGEGLSVPTLEKVDEGRYAFELHGCAACHVVDGEGGVVGPDLSGVALKGYSREWQIRHLRDPVDAVEGSKMMSFGHLSDAEMDVVVSHLDTLVGAPQLVRGKALAVRLGCRGCHRIGGVGGDHGPDLSRVGLKRATDLDFAGVDGPRTVAAWHRAHLREPTRVAPGSKMPAYLLAAEDEDAIVTYLLSLRGGHVRLDLLPKETVRARLDDTRDYPGDGEALFATFCAVCHGERGEGQYLESLGRFVPSARNPDMLSIASDQYLEYTIDHGRPGRDMPPWGTKDGGLAPEEVQALVAWLRAAQPVPPSFSEVRAVARPDSSRGQVTYDHDCAGCHGLLAEGTVIAPSLANAEFSFVASDRFLYETIVNGRANTGMPAHTHLSAEVAAGLISWIRSVSRSTPRDEARMRATIDQVLHVRRLDDYVARGSVPYGRLVYASMCLACHGAEGHGGVGTAIANPDFLRNASDGLIAGTILLGRGQRAMRAFGPDGLAHLEGREIGDLIAYLRWEGGREGDAPKGRRVQGDVRLGRESYDQFCSGCHGSEGRGESAPALANPQFLAAATDGYLQATIARGRRGTPMRAWAHGGYGFAEVSPEEINDMVAYIRSWQD